MRWIFIFGFSSCRAYGPQFKFMPDAKIAWGDVGGDSVFHALHRRQIPDRFYIGKSVTMSDIRSRQAP